MRHCDSIREDADAECRFSRHGTVEAGVSAVLEDGKRAGWGGLAGGAIARCLNGRVGGDGGRDGDRGRRGDAEGRSLEGLVDQRRGGYEEQDRRQMVRGQEGDVREWRLERWRGYPPIAERAKQERRPASRVGSRMQRGARAAGADEQGWKLLTMRGLCACTMRERG